MVTFNLQGRDVGPRLLQAIRRDAAKGPVALHCSGATFMAALDLSDLKIAGADFTDATFKSGIRLSGVRFEGEACFDRAESSDFWLQEATFVGPAWFRGLRAANLMMEAVSFERYASFDGAKLGFGGFRDVRFAAEARFRQTTSRATLTFRSVHFAAATSFQNCEMRRLAFPGCEFRGPFQARDLEVEETLEFVGATFSDTSSLELKAGSDVSLRDTSFAQPLTLAIKSPVLQATRARFERGADILLDGGAEAAFEGASFLGPSLISAQVPAEVPAKLTSLDRARAERLALEGLDLSECSFARMHRLDDVLISGRGQLALAPAVVEGSYRREVLADEVLRRAVVPTRMLEWVATKWQRPPGLEEENPLEARVISDTYRAMRKAREESHDYPGAADFYYGEMEMRRESADSWVEKTILTLYWLISGYGLRASRAAIAFAIGILLLAACFQTVGLENPSDFWHTLGWTLTTSVSLTKPVETMGLTTGGLYLNVAARILGPALIALVVLALRSRVRR